MKNEEKVDSNQKENKPDKKKYKIKEADQYEETKKDGALKPTIKISENVHIKPAEEQQFENNISPSQ